LNVVFWLWPVRNERVVNHWATDGPVIEISVSSLCVTSHCVYSRLFWVQ